MNFDDRMKAKFVYVVLVLALTAALPKGALAEEAAPQPSRDSKPANSGAHPSDSSPVGKDAAPDSGAVNTQDVDTRITVQPHGPPAGKPGRLGGAASPVVPFKLANPHRRTFSPSRAAHRSSPNDSGFSGVQHQDVQQNQGARFDYKSLGQGPAMGAPGGGVASFGLAKPGGVPVHQPFVRPSGISPIGNGAKNFTHGGIGGPSLNHRTVQSSTVGIGGPARTATGIDGTSIHKVH
jgi:hypothetical protein